MPRHKHRARDLLDSDDGWATVPGRNRAPLRLAPPAEAPASDLELDTAALARALAVFRAQLAAEPVLAPALAAAAALTATVRTVLVLGLGSFALATQDSSLLQLGMVLSALDVLPAPKPAVVFRDPAFTARDKAFLGAFGRVADADVAGDAGTLLLAPHLEFSVLAAHLETYRPMLVVCNDLGAFMDLCVALPTVGWWETLTRRRRMGEKNLVESFGALVKEDGDYNKALLVVEDKGGHGLGRAFNDLAVFWRKDCIRD